MPTDLASSRHNSGNITFLASADDKHQRFIGPYITSVLTTYPAARCEILMKDAGDWPQKNWELYSILCELFPGQFSLRDVPDWCQHKKPATWRWVTTPYHQTPLTCITDIDILICDPEIPGAHKRLMQLQHRPFSVFKTVVDDLFPFLCVDTVEYYKLMSGEAYRRACARLGSEDTRLLYDMLLSRRGAVDLPEEYPPSHGPQLSLDREWRFSDRNCRNYVTMSSSSTWLHALREFPMEFQATLSRLHATFATLQYPEWTNR